jgi:hypothetical protein
MRITTEILDEALASIEGAQYRITLECSYSDTLRICADLLAVIEFSEDAMKEYKHEDAKQALFIRSHRLRITTTALRCRQANQAWRVGSREAVQSDNPVKISGAVGVLSGMPPERSSLPKGPMHTPGMPPSPCPQRD